MSAFPADENKTESALTLQFIKDVGLPSNIAPHALSLKASDYMSWFSGHRPDIVSRPQIISLSQYLNINEDSILTGRYDKNLIRRKIFEGPEVLPEKYSENQFSYVRSSAHIIKYLTLTRGQHFSDGILRSLNISPLIYANNDNKISINYFVDLLDALAAANLNQTELDSLAGMLFLGLEGTALGEKFQKARNYYECYIVLAENIKLFDSNFEYVFELDTHQVLIHSTFSFDKHFHEKWDLERMMRLVRYRQILSGWYPYLSKLPPLVAQHSLKTFNDRIEASYLIEFSDKPVTKLVNFESDSTLHFL
jgi:hypothetical protein